MGTLNLLYKNNVPITNKISIYVPTVREVLEDEDAYYGLISMFTAMPIDMMVQLDDVGIDFTEIDEWQLFVILFPAIQKMDTHLLFKDLDLSKFGLCVHKKTDKIVLRDEENDITIDFALHGQIAATLRHLHHLTKDRRKPANESAKSYMLERARLKAKRRRRKTDISHIEELIIAMVNTSQYKYNFEETLDLTIYQFNESVRQVVRKDGYDHRMNGIYAGTVDAKKINKQDLNWLTSN